MLPVGQRSLANLREEWDQHLRWLRAFEANLGAGAVQTPFFVHPVAGPITLLQALRMDLLHVQIHTRQVSKILKSQTRQDA
jgi:acetamidase/formamidase